MELPSLSKGGHCSSCMCAIRLAVVTVGKSAVLIRVTVVNFQTAIRAAVATVEKRLLQFVQLSSVQRSSLLTG